MPFFYFLVLFFSIILLIKYLLFWIYLWQLKEYRLDRMRDFLCSPEGRQIWLSKNYLVKIGLIVLWAVFYILAYIAFKYTTNLNFYFLLVLICLPINFLIIGEVVWFILKILRREVILPVWTKRAQLTVLISIGLSTSLISLIFKFGFYYEQVWLVFILLLIITFAPIAVSVIVILTMPFTLVVKFYIYRRAKLKRQQFKDLIVIGITGSYGKTSVKEFLAQILAAKFKVLKTAKNINTEIGIAQTILKKLQPSHQIFVCEMGAYQKGEIKKSGQIARPQIAVITGICEQHLSLFGSLANIIAAKSEIISSLSQDGVVFLNYDSQNVRQIKVPADCQKITYGLSSTDVDILASQVEGKWKVEIKKLCSLRSRNWEIEKFGYWKLEVGSLLGKHNILNLLPAIAIALSLGMSRAEIESAIKKIKPPAGTMRVFNTREATKFTLIDDTYNANPAGVKAALEILSDYNTVGSRQCLDPTVAKILILDDILELGHEALRIHQEIGEQIAKMKLTKVVLVGKNYADWLRIFLLKAGFASEQAIIYQPGMKIDDLVSGQKAVILFEGRRAKEILDLVLASA